VSGDDNKRVIQRFYGELWTQGDLSVADEIIDKDFRGHAPGSTESRGPEGVRQFVDTWRSAFPDLRIDIDAQYASDDDRVATQFTCTGTQSGPLMGIPATNRSVRMNGVAISRLRDGRIASDWGEFDMLGLLMQLGVARPPGAGPPPAGAAQA
jgi:steroid delta-isomerase-like uncharacterized protein